MKCRHCRLEICQGTLAMISEMGGVPIASDTTKPLYLLPHLILNILWGSHCYPYLFKDEN